MTKLNKIFFLFLLLSLKISNQLPTGKVINTCGKLGYDPPNSASDCVEKGEYCCFLRIQNTKDPTEGEICCFVSLLTPNNQQPIKFCVSSPSDIDESDVKSEIEKYTGYQINELKCNNSKIIKNSMAVLFILLFILF